MDRLNAEIDALSDTRDHAELVAALQRVLRNMSFYISQSEAAVNEYREAWHDDYTDALYADAGRSRGDGGAASVARTPSGRAAAPSAGRGPPTEHKSSRGTKKGGRGRRAAHSAREDIDSMIDQSRAEAQARIDAAHQAAVARTAAARGRQEDIPASLRAIMDGSHPSFKQDDGFS